MLASTRRRIHARAPLLPVRGGIRTPMDMPMGQFFLVAGLLSTISTAKVKSSPAMGDCRPG